MIGSRIAIQTLSLKQPIKQALHTAGHLRCEGVQIDARSELKPEDLGETAARQLRKVLEDLNLRIASVRFPNRRGYATPQDLQRRVDATTAALRMAARLRAATLVCSLGPVPAEGASERETLCDVLASLSKLGDRLGVQVAVESSASDPDEVARLLEPYSPGGLGVDLSPADAVLQGRDLEKLVASLGPRVVHVRANDAVRGLGPSSGVCVPLGRGSVDVPRLLSWLEELNYRGWITVETRNSDDPETQLANAVAYLRAL